MKRAGVAELKARLSQYLARVRGGDEVIVYDRDTPIARLVPYSGSDDGFVIRESTVSAATLKAVRGIKPKRPVDIVRMLRESRNRR